MNDATAEERWWKWTLKPDAANPNPFLYMRRTNEREYLYRKDAVSCGGLGLFTGFAVVAYWREVTDPDELLVLRLAYPLDLPVTSTHR